jgi:hypothetical protein
MAGRLIFTLLKSYALDLYQQLIAEVLICNLASPSPNASYHYTLSLLFISFVSVVFPYGSRSQQYL